MKTEKSKEKLDAKIVHELSPEVLEVLREKYKARIESGRIKRILLDMDENGKQSLEVAVLVPNRTTQDEFMKFLDRDPGKAQKILVRNCLVSNIDQVHGDDYLFNTCVSAITDLFPIGSFEIKNF